MSTCRTGKEEFVHLDDARRAASRQAHRGLEAYSCQWCQRYHIGRPVGRRDNRPVYGRRFRKGDR